MEPPTVRTSARDEERNITFHVMAYRQLTEAELIQAIRCFRSTKQGRRLRKNSTYTIISLIGLRD